MKKFAIYVQSSNNVLSKNIYVKNEQKTFSVIKSKNLNLGPGEGSGPWGEWAGCPACKVDGQDLVETRTRDCGGDQCESDTRACDDVPELCRKKFICFLYYFVVILIVQ